MAKQSERIQLLNKMLITFGFTGIEDYDNSISPKSLKSNDTFLNRINEYVSSINKLYSESEINLKRTDYKIHDVNFAFDIIRKMLKLNNIKFNTKRDQYTTYLQLKPSTFNRIDNMISLINSNPTVNSYSSRQYKLLFNINKDETNILPAMGNEYEHFDIISIQCKGNGNYKLVLAHNVLYYENINSINYIETFLNHMDYLPINSLFYHNVLIETYDVKDELDIIITYKLRNKKEINKETFEDLIDKYINKKPLVIKNDLDNGVINHNVSTSPFKDDEFKYMYNCYKNNKPINIPYSITHEIIINESPSHTQNILRITNGMGAYVFAE